jgi:NAD(P)-dependent dehydrogenase (short-subunit alcohol dehydrogenase family)
MTWHNVMHVNVNAPFLLTQALLPLLYKSDDGAAVYASSSVGRRGRAHWGAYSVSKFALEGFAQTLADESEGRLRVNCVNPGATRTAMRRAAFPAEAADTLATPEQVAGAFLYCLGPDSHGATGRSFNAQAK